MPPAKKARAKPLSNLPSKNPVVWMGSTKGDLTKMPDEVKEVFGFALYQAQIGQRHADAKPMEGIPVVEVCDDYQGDTYRAVYTAKLDGYVFVLHCFKKKSKRGIATPQPDLDLIRRRLKDAVDLHNGWTKRRAK